MTTEEQSRIVQTLDQGSNKYYVYALCKSDGTPFYIGKGCGCRVFDHENVAQLTRESIDSDDTLTEEAKADKIARQTEKMQTILAQDGDPVKVIIKWGLSEHEALMCESSLINMLGFMANRQVSCRALTNIINGHASKQEKDSVADVKTRAREVNTFLKECAIPERGIENIESRVAFIKINKLYHECFDNNGNVEDWKVRECARGCWPVAEIKRDQIEYIFALYRRRVVGIYHVNRVWPVTTPTQEDFPDFPPDIRGMDRWLSRFASIEDAQQELAADNFERFLKRLDKEDKTEEEVLTQFRCRRVYFSVDDNVPESLRAYMNTLLTKNNSGEFLKSQWPVQYNF